MSRLALILMLLLAPFAALAVQPDEVLDNPVLESRARDISQKMRCPVCQGESIDESNAGVSRDLRLYIRERLVAGDSDAEVVDAVVDRFGEFVLFDPPMCGINLLLWFAAPVAALLGLILAFVFLHGRSRAASSIRDLNEAERARLDEIMHE